MIIIDLLPNFPPGVEVVVLPAPLVEGHPAVQEGAVVEGVGHLRGVGEEGVLQEGEGHLTKAVEENNIHDYNNLYKTNHTSV